MKNQPSLMIKNEIMAGIIELTGKINSDLITTDNGTVLRHVYYMLYKGFIGIYVTVRTFDQ